MIEPTVVFPSISIYSGKKHCHHIVSPIAWTGVLFIVPWLFMASLLGGPIDRVLQNAIDLPSQVPGVTR